MALLQLCSTVTKTFKGKNESEANAKADAWLRMQEGVRNIQRHSYLFRSAFLITNSEGEWSVTIRYDLDRPPSY
jgi:hypothetical protein